MAAYYYASPWTNWTTSSGSLDTTNVWLDWTDGTTGGTTANLTTANSGTVWLKWASVDATGCDDSWVTWSAATGPTVRVNCGAKRYVDHRTPEQRTADETRLAAARAEDQRKAAEAVALRKAAQDRAWQLLLSMLDHQQRQQLQTDRFFEVIARHSRRRYRIRHGTHGNVRLLNAQGQEVVSYCAQPGGVPTEDAMLAQKLQIEHDEAAFLKVANPTRLRAA